VQSASVPPRQSDKLLDGGLVRPFGITGKPNSGFTDGTGALVHRRNAFGRKFVSGGVHKHLSHLATKEKAADEELQRWPWRRRLISIVHATMMPNQWTLLPG
jgi:hypothetical protein